MSRKIFWKIFHLPGPSELGMTNNKDDALPMRDFMGRGQTGPTWEDWEERVKRDYPIRYFFAEELVPWIKLQYRRYVDDPIYWIKCHLITKHKYHLIDIREPKGDPNAYRYGWIDSDTKMLLALFTILNDFVRDEMPHWYCPSEEDVQSDPSLIHQRNSYLEAKNIHYWWNVERKRQEKAQRDLLHAWHEAKKNQDPHEHQLWDDLKNLEKADEEKTEEMIARLLKIRHRLWT